MIKRQAGVGLIEAFFALTLVSIALGALLKTYAEGEVDRARTIVAQQVANYVTAVGQYLSDQGRTPPAVLNQGGVDWLKSTDCVGGQQPVGEGFLPCNFPSAIGVNYGLNPTAQFDYVTDPGIPRVSIDFGQVIANGDISPLVAGELAEKTQEQVRSQGYQQIDVTNYLQADRSDIYDGNLYAEITLSANGDIWLRRDGTTDMEAPLVSVTDDWAMITRNAAGNENSAAKNRTASVNVNDIYIRAAGYWASDVAEIAEESYRRSSKAVQYIAEVPSGALVPKPDCDLGLTPQIVVAPAAFVGGTQSVPRFISGIRRDVTDVGPDDWEVALEALYDGTSTWQRLDGPGRVGQVMVVTKCG